MRTASRARCAVQGYANTSRSAVGADLTKSAVTAKPEVVLLSTGREYNAWIDHAKLQRSL